MQISPLCSPTSTNVFQIPFSPRIKTLVIVALLWLVASDIQAEQEVVPHTDSPSLLFAILFAVGLIGLSILIIASLTHWANKQDSITNMMPFCIKHLVENSSEVVKGHSARGLGNIKDPRALLILVGVINDEKVTSHLQQTANEALQTMATKYPKYEKLIPDLLKASKEGNHTKTLILLMVNFENQNKEYVQSAYVIGREYMRLRKYVDARLWLQKAKLRNKKHAVYDHQILSIIAACNERLFAEGDTLFNDGDYRQALERFALASHDIEEKQVERFASHLRLTCVYCKLNRYQEAFQEMLHAIADHHETDSTSLELKRLLKLRLEGVGDKSGQEQREKLQEQISAQSFAIMSRLTDRGLSETG